MAAPLSYVGAIRGAVASGLDAPASVFAGRVRSWRDTLDRAARIAGGLRAAGIAAGDRVGVLSPNNDDYMALYLAVPWAGAVLVPLNCRWSQAENSFAIEDCRPRLIFVSEDMADANAALLAGEDAPALVSLGKARPGWRTLEDLLASAAIEDAGRGGDDLLAIFYTGGTTGRSKGVMLSHAGLVANCSAMRDFGLFPPGCRTLIVPPLFHLAAAATLTTTMLSGGTAVIDRAFDPVASLDLIAAERTTDAMMVPTMIQMMLDAPHSLRRLADAGSDARSHHGRRTAYRFHPGLWHDRSIVHRDLAPRRLSSGRPSRGRAAPGRGQGAADRRSEGGR